MNELLAPLSFEFSLKDTPIKMNPLIEKMKDIRWRLENLYWIEDKRGKVVKLKLNEAQRELLNELHYRNIILKARQLGMSTFIAIFFLDQVLFHKNIQAAIVADKLDSGKNIFRKVEFAWMNFDPAIKDLLNLQSTVDQGAYIKFTNGSSLRVGTTLHSGTYQLLHLSELGPLCKESPEKAADIIKSAFPTVADELNTVIFIESTAEGEGNEFHIRCQDAEALTEEAEKRNPENPSAGLLPFDYRFFFFPWWGAKEYEYPEDIANRVKIPPRLTRYFEMVERKIKQKLSLGKKAWYVSKERTLKARMPEQYPSYPEEAFLTSGDKLFDIDILQQKIESESRKPLPQIIDSLNIYSPYKRGHRYALGADVGHGIGRDHSTMVVIDFTVNEIVATYANQFIDPIEFAGEIIRVANIYGGCLVAPEANDWGGATVLTLNKSYPNLYHYEIKGNAEVVQTERLGWLTNAATKPRLIFDLKEAFESELMPLKSPDKGVLVEAISYSKQDLRATAKELEKSSRHFDKLMAAGIAWQMRDYAQVAVDEVDARAIHKVRERRERNRSHG